MTEKELTIQDFGINYQPPILTISNYEGLQKQLEDELTNFNNLVITESNLKSIKKTKAQLNSLKKQLDGKRKQVKREYNIPYNEFKAKIDGLIGQVDQVFIPIDKGVKELEEKQREERKQHVLELINEMAPEYDVKPEDVPFDPKWTNKSLSELQRTRDIAESLQTLRREQKLAVANRQLIIAHVKDKGMSEAESWLQLLDNGQEVQEVINAIDRTAQKIADDAERKQKEKEAQEAIARANQVTTDDGRVIDETTGEIVAKHYHLVLAFDGTDKELRNLLNQLKANGTKYSIVSNKEV
ncbi:hypothetical protein DS831_04550 [Bombilactobacillus bombi]|uniref:DUF1351 domain-containing protein n=1 Tax=Bombilactobacillus bombi TaxID=1303590 RepID=A0A3R6YN30_9LACO|nr:DUF1351 domain-containing protein [Bombilactobacillus bombi]RHW51296.1 hypothetical protein DS831_04550 [Bombilactobacillus bombi]